MHVLLAMLDGSKREAFRLLLESERSDCTVHLSGNGRDTLDEIQAIVPDILILDQVLPQLDGQAVLNALASMDLACPPKVVFLTAPGQVTPPVKGADVYLPALVEPDQLLCAVRDAEEKLQGKLAAIASDQRCASIQAHFKELGMPCNLKGRIYLTFLLDLAVPSPSLLNTLTARLYPAAAAQYSTTPAAVERCIRHAIEATWSRGDMAALERLFGLSIDPDRGKPTNREFLAMSAQHLRLVYTDHHIF